MEVEFDAAKDAANQAKHGLPLTRGREMDLARALVTPALRRDYGEARLAAYGNLDGRLHVMVFTVREGRMRVISLRRANGREVGRYGPR